LSDELRLQLLGSPQIALGGVPLPRFAYHKSLALLCYLAVSGRSHSRDSLAALLWDTSSQANARASLRKALAELRAHLPAHVQITLDAVAFNRAAPYWLDVEALGQLFLQSLPASGLWGDEQATKWAEAVDWYQGEFLEGLNVRDASPFEEWVLMQRERLHLSVLQALRRLADHYARQAAYVQSLKYATRLLELNPTHQDVHRLRMTLLTLMGQRENALQQFKACRTALRQQLGTKPDAQTIALYERIRAGKPLEAPSWSARHNLPTPLTPLIGRERELLRIAERLRDPSCRLLSLVGPGGVGKTHLALEAALSQVGQFEHGVFFVALGSLQSTQAFVAAIARETGLSTSEVRATASTEQNLLTQLRSRQMLLLLDGAERLLAGPDQLRNGSGRLVLDVLQSAPGVKLLVTSRVRLRLQGEHCLPLAGLEIPPPDGAADPDRFASVQLFLHAVQRVRPDLTLTDTDLAAVARICRFVAGLPLAIVLAAPWLVSLSPTQIAERISPSGAVLDWLQQAWPEVPPGQRSMRAIFDHSWSLLTARQRGILQSLAVFRGGFTEASAGQVSGASMRELTTLADRSLLQHSGTDRYGLHPLLRRYLEEKLRSSPKAAERAHGRHSSFFASALRRWYIKLQGPRQQMVLADMAAESANALVAWEWAVKQGHLSQLDQAMDGLCLFYHRSGRFQDGERASGMAVKITSRVEAPSVALDGRLRVQARALAWQAVFAHALGRTGSAKRLLRRSLQLLDHHSLASNDAQREEAFALLHKGRAALDDKPELARASFERSLALYQALGNRWGVANVLDAMGSAANRRGDHTAARLATEECLVLRRELGDVRGTLRCLRFLADPAEPGDLAVQRSQDAHSSPPRRETGTPGLLPPELLHVSYAVSQGRYGEAQRLLEQCAVKHADLSQSDAGGLLCMVQAMVHAHVGRYLESRTQAEKCLAACMETGSQWGLAMCYCSLGSVAVAAKSYAEASQWLLEGLAICRRNGLREDLGFSLTYLALASRGLGKVAEAWHYVGQALVVAAATNVNSLQLLATEVAALLLADQGEAERAVELDSLVTRYPTMANSKWFEDISAEPLADAVASLPPSVRAEILTRGRSRDLHATLNELSAEFGVPTA
jgi:predicted ATPase/DNA-binding SARP family transcriptional activator